jgi:hypothetical protein
MPWSGGQTGELMYKYQHFLDYFLDYFLEYLNIAKIVKQKT